MLGDFRSSDLAGNILTCKQHCGGIRIVGYLKRQISGRFDHRIRINRVDTSAQDGQGGNAVHRTRIHILRVELLR